MDQEVTKCVQLNYHTLLMRSLLANMDTISSATQPAKSISVLDAVICIAEAAKQVSPETVQRYSQEARFSTNE
jgi:hypothetical protein